MSTEVISSNVYQPLNNKVNTKPVSLLTRAKKIILNGYSLLKALEYLNVKVENKTVVITHDVGTSVTFREDGNIDVCTERNFVQRTKGLLHLNPVNPSDDNYTNFEALLDAFPERFKQSS